MPNSRSHKEELRLLNEKQQALPKETSFERAKRETKEQAENDSYKKVSTPEEEQFVPSKGGNGAVDKALWDAGVR